MLINVIVGWVLLVSVTGGDVIATHYYDNGDACHGWVDVYNHVKATDADAVWTVPERSFETWRFQDLSFECHEG